jgi:cation diffusion facilitator CzcD-associated flavoprotein CzcO
MGRTQNNKGTYALSDLPMPRGYPEWPTGAQVQAYLESYVDKFGLGPSLRLGTEVTYATPVADGWEVAAGATTETFGHLVVANGIFSDPVIPPFDGVDVFESAGGRLLAACDFHDLAGARGKHVVVVGYGKTSCDVSREISKVAASTTVVARELLWKMPKRLNGVVNYKYVMLTRMGEGLFRYQTLPEPRSSCTAGATVYAAACSAASSRSPPDTSACPSSASSPTEPSRTSPEAPSVSPPTVSTRRSPTDASRC